MLFYKPPLVEMTITTCRRLTCFLRTIESFYENMADKHLLWRITCSDDNSSSEDRAEMQRRFPEIEYIWMTQKGHAHSLQTLFSRLRAKFVLHWEDDFILKFKGNHITRCLAILDEHPTVGSVILTPNTGEKHTNGYGDYFLKLFDPRTARACPAGCGFDRNYGQPKNPGFSLNPGLHRVTTLQSIPWPLCDHHEFQFARAYHNAGHRVAYLDKFYVQHIGSESAYRLNNTKR